MKLVICEKPSVAKSIASALGIPPGADSCYVNKEMIISWCSGHLVSPLDAWGYDDRYKKWKYEDLPILPEPFRYTIIHGKQECFETIREMMSRPDVDCIVNACDAGREGELIFRLVYELTGCGKPVQRLWISSMEDSAIREGFKNLRPGAEFDNLYHAALCRQKADWLVGINATRLFSILYHHTLNVGRVQTPTLALLVQRDADIRQFTPTPYYHVRLALPGCEAVSKSIPRKVNAETILMACQGETVTCTAVRRKMKKDLPPRLYDLTSLQRDANRLLGFTAKQTLDYAQSLYEKKLLTYPRTGSRFLTSDMAETASCVIHLAAKLSPFDKYESVFPDISALLSDKDVSDHHAIIPTAEIERSDIGSLPFGERMLLLLVCCRLLCAIAEDCIYETITAEFMCSGAGFIYTGKQNISEGWKEIYRCFIAILKDKPEAETEATQLPKFAEGQTFENIEVSITQHFTTAPSPYTEDTLLRAMETAGAEDIPDDAERKGLGTPATRAAIIEKLIISGFVERDGKKLLPTKAGTDLISVLPKTLTSPMLTAEWETQLTAIANGNADSETFMADIRTMVDELVDAHSQSSETGHKLFAPEREIIGCCPRCGMPVYEGKNNFYCADRSCSFVLWKRDRFWNRRKKELNAEIAAQLLKEGSALVRGLWSERAMRAYDAVVVMDDTGGKYVNFKLEFPDKKHR